MPREREGEGEGEIVRECALLAPTWYRPRRRLYLIRSWREKMHALSVSVCLPFSVSVCLSPYLSLSLSLSAARCRAARSCAGALPPSLCLSLSICLSVSVCLSLAVAVYRSGDVLAASLRHLDRLRAYFDWGQSPVA